MIDTIPWEGYREGVDDVRYVTTLEKMIAKAKDSESRALRLHVALAEEYLTTLRNGDRIESEDLDTIRLEMIDHILSLKQ